MKSKFQVFLIFCIFVSSTVGKDDKKKKVSSPKSKELFDSVTIKCLVCKSVVDEFKYSIAKIDPKKMIESGTFRVDGNGVQAKTSIPYARSQFHLMEVVDQVCKNFEDYAQAKFKKNGKPTIIRLTTPQGNLNPLMKEIDIVPDEDLNKKLKFHCESVVEDLEEHLTTLFAEDPEPADIENQICSIRSSYCKKNKKTKKHKKNEL